MRVISWDSCYHMIYLCVYVMHMLLGVLMCERTCVLFRCLLYITDYAKSPRVHAKNPHYAYRFHWLVYFIAQASKSTAFAVL